MSDGNKARLIWFPELRQPPIDGKAASLLRGKAGWKPNEKDKVLRQATQRLEGGTGLSSDNNNDEQPAPKPRKQRKGAGTDEVGKALRSAYDETLREDVPDDFLDLLGKLS